MSTIVFDTHATIKKLIGAGFTEKQAEAQTEVLAELVEDRLATKGDLTQLRLHLEHQLDKLTIKFGAMLATAVIIIGVLIKIL